MSLVRYCLAMFFLMVSFNCSLHGENKTQRKKLVTKKVVKRQKIKQVSPLKKVVPLSEKKDKTPIAPLSKTTSIPPHFSNQLQPPNKLPELRSLQDSNEKLIILDPGHGGYDLGARMASIDEKSLALSTAFLTKKHLLSLGYRVILTRSRDVFLSLEKRALIANEMKGKLFVSIHFNAAKNPIAKGVEVFYFLSEDKMRSGSSKKLASGVLGKVIDKTASENRGVKEGNFFVIRETLMPAILVEAGFMTHPDELHRLKDVIYRDKIARGIAEGIHLYFQQ